MAFRAGNKARKKESVQDTVEEKYVYIDGAIDEFHHVVGEFTHDILQNIKDRVNAAVLLYRVESYKENLTEELNKEEELKKSTKGKNKTYKDTPYWKTLVNKIKKMENSNESILPLLKHKSNYCFNPIIRKLFAGDITDFVAYPYPVNCGLKLNPDEKELLIEINNFKCSFMEETMGNLYLSTKIILSNEEIPEGIFDWLGYYTKRIFTNPDQVEPEVWLLINKIEAESISLGCDRKYILAKVYIHEMMHRYYDMHPELLLKEYVKEIEEPMANFATLKFCEEFCNERDNYSDLLPIARKQIEELRGDKTNYIYALGGDLYDFKYSTSLINEYRHMCMMMHENNNPVKMMHEDNDPVEKYKTIVSNQKACYNKKERNDEAAKTLCDELEKCIEEYIL